MFEQVLAKDPDSTIGLIVGEKYIGYVGKSHFEQLKLFDSSDLLPRSHFRKEQCHPQIDQKGVLKNIIKLLKNV